jgi:hypothetical protein
MPRNAFLMYVDDWLSSSRIELMDAHEERGYLRLLLHAWKQPDCGLPTDDLTLAAWSKMGPQWMRETADRKFRVSGVTSGQKVRACFVERNGRLFNERQFREWENQLAYVEKQKDNGKRGGRPKKEPIGYLPDNPEETQAFSGENPGLSFGLRLGYQNENPNHNPKKPNSNSNSNYYELPASVSVSGVDVTPSVRSPLVVETKTPPYSEFPETARAVREVFPATDDGFMLKLLHNTAQALANANMPIYGEMTDSLLSKAVRNCRGSTPNQTSAGLFLTTVPQCVKTWMTQAPTNGNGQKHIDHCCKRCRKNPCMCTGVAREVLFNDRVAS